MPFLPHSPPPAAASPLLPRANRTQTDYEVAGGESRSFRPRSPVRNFIAISCLSSHLGRRRRRRGGARGNCRTSMFSRPFSNAAAVAMSVVADGERERERERQVANRTSHRMWAGWAVDGQTDGHREREREGGRGIFAL